MIRGSCWLSFRSPPIREYLRVPYWLLFNVCPAIYAFPHFESRTPNVSVFYITEWSFWCSNEFNGGQCEMKLRRLQQASFLPCTVENDKRQLQAQFPQHTNSGISSGALLVVIQCYHKPQTLAFRFHGVGLCTTGKETAIICAVTWRLATSYIMMNQYA